MYFLMGHVFADIGEMPPLMFPCTIALQHSGLWLIHIVTGVQ